MFIFTSWALRAFGFSGILGALLFICGDLSYNHVPGSTARLAGKMAQLSATRLLKAGTLGLVGYWFYTLAVFHLYLAFRPGGEIFAFILTLAFAAVMICYGISHAAYFSIAAGAQLATNNGLDVEKGGQLGESVFPKTGYHHLYPGGNFQPDDALWNRIRTLAVPKMDVCFLTSHHLPSQNAHPPDPQRARARAGERLLR